MRADSASQYIIGSQTLIPNGPTITVNNMPYALPSSPTAIMSGGSIIALDPKNSADPGVLSVLSAAGFRTTKPTQVYTVNGIYLTDDPNALVVGSTTLNPGSPALTVSRHTFSLASGGALIVDGATRTMASATSNVLTNGGAAGPTTGASGFGSDRPFQTFTIDGTYLTGSPNALAVGGKTLLPGSSPLTVSGHTLSLATGGVLIVDGSSSVLASNTLSTLPLSGVAPTREASASGNGTNTNRFTSDVNREKPTRVALRLLVSIAVIINLVC